MSNEKLFEEIQQFLSKPKGKILLDWQVENIIYNFLEMRGKRGADEQEVIKLIRWFELAIITQTLVKLFFEGYVDVDWQDDDAVFQISEKGIKALQVDKLDS